MSDYANGNGNGNRLIWWILSALASVVIGGGGFWVKSIESKVEAVTSIQQARGERITALETVLPYIKERLDNIDKKLDRFETERRYQPPQMPQPPSRSRFE